VSAIEPVPTVIGHEPMTPAKNRKTINAPKLLATAHAMLKTTKRVMQTLYRYALPYISDSGAMAMGPKVYPSKKTVVMKAPRVSLVEPK